MIKTRERINISVIIPIFNEEENIRPLYSEIIEVFAETDRNYEVIIIDDCPRDNSLEKLIFRL